MSTLNARISGAVRRYHPLRPRRQRSPWALPRREAGKVLRGRRHGGLRRPPGRGFRAPGGVDEVGGCLRGRTLDRRSTRSRVLGKVAGQALAGAAVVWRGAAANPACSPKPNADSPRPTTRPPVSVRAPSPASGDGTAQPGQRKRRGGAAGMVTDYHPEPKVAAALKDPSYRLKTTTADRIPRRSRSGQCQTDNSAEALTRRGPPNSDRQIGPTCRGLNATAR